MGADKDDLILATLMEVKEDVGIIKEKTEQQDDCIAKLTTDMAEQQKINDQITGGLKVIIAIGTVAGVVIGWIASHIPQLSFIK